MKKGGDLFLFEVRGTDIQNIEISNGVLIDWPGNLAVEGGEMGRLREVEIVSFMSQERRREIFLLTYSDEIVVE